MPRKPLQASSEGVLPFRFYRSGVCSAFRGRLPSPRTTARRSHFAPWPAPWLARTIATIPARIASGSCGHASAISARSAGMLLPGLAADRLDFAPLLSCDRPECKPRGKLDRKSLSLLDSHRTVDPEVAGSSPVTLVRAMSRRSVPGRDISRDLRSPGAAPPGRSVVPSGATECPSETGVGATYGAGTSTTSRPSRSSRRCERGAGRVSQGKMARSNIRRRPSALIVDPRLAKSQFPSSHCPIP